jgi:hypothetical protein
MMCEPVRSLLTALAILGCAAAGAHAAGEAPDAAAQCTTPPPARTGTVYTERFDFALELLALAPIIRPKPQSEPASVWCFESALATGNQRMRVFRNTGEQGMATPSQAIRVDGPAPRDFYVAFSGTVFMAVLTNSRPPSPTWRPYVLYGTHNGEPALYEIFGGEPDLATTAATIADILSGKRAPIAYLSEGTLFVPRLSPSR